MNRRLIALNALLLCVTTVAKTVGQESFRNTVMPQLDALVERDLKPLGEISCSFSSNGKETYSLVTAFNGPYALMKMRRNGKGWDSMRNLDYYASVKVDPSKPSQHSITHLIKKSDDSWSPLIELKKLPIFSMAMTGPSTISNLVRSGAFSVDSKDLDNGRIEYILTATEKESDVYQYVMEYDSAYEFPTALAEYTDDSRLGGSKYVVNDFEEIDGFHYPTSMEFAQFFGERKNLVTMDIKYDSTKELSVDQCKLEAYGLSKPNIVLANRPKSPLQTILVAALILFVISGGAWFFIRKSRT